MAFGGFGRSGGVEITHQNDETRRKISIRTASSMAVILNVITLCAYFVVWLFWWFLLIRSYDAPWGCSGFCEWWGRMRYVVGSWGRVMGMTWPLWVIPLPMEWPTPLLILYRRNLLPKLLNDEWPPTSAQMDPNKSGFVTAENWDERAGVGVVASAMPEREEINVMIEDHVTTETAYPERQKCVLFSPAGHPGALARYAAALIREDENTRAAFSFAGGQDHHGADHWGYTRKEFSELSTEAERAGLVYREKKNQSFEITERGKLTFKRLAEKGLGSTSLLPRPEIT